MIVLRESQYSTVPWKNGGGVTREIHREPSGPGAFDWRLSLATVASRGPFSAFDGYERTLVLVRGAGVLLSFSGHGESRLSSVGQMATFDGAWQTTGAPIDGPCTDLNLMVAKATLQADTRSIELTTDAKIATAGHAQTIICCIDGSVAVNTAAGGTAGLHAVDVARCFPSDGVITCRSAGPTVARVFVAAVRARS